MARQEYQKEYKQRNRIRLNEYARKRNKENPEISREARRRYKERYPERIRASMLIRAWVNRMQIIETLGGCCAQCGYKEHLDGLEIDHVVPLHQIAGKRTFGSLGVLSWKTLESRLVGCQLLCGTCHNIKTRQEIRNRAALTTALAVQNTSL